MSNEGESMGQTMRLRTSFSDFEKEAANFYEPKFRAAPNHIPDIIFECNEAGYDFADKKIAAFIKKVVYLAVLDMFHCISIEEFWDMRRTLEHACEFVVYNHEKITDLSARVAALEQGKDKVVPPERGSYVVSRKTYDSICERMAALHSELFTLSEVVRCTKPLNNETARLKDKLDKMLVKASAEYSAAKYFIKQIPEPEIT